MKTLWQKPWFMTSPSCISDLRNWLSLRHGEVDAQLCKPFFLGMVTVAGFTSWSPENMLNKISMIDSWNPILSYVYPFVCVCVCDMLNVQRKTCNGSFYIFKPWDFDEVSHISQLPTPTSIPRYICMNLPLIPLKSLSKIVKHYIASDYPQ